MLVNIREIFEKVVEVESVEEAEEKWRKSQIELYSTDFKGVEFTEYESE